MGNQKQKWTQEEEEALRAGVAKHGTGKWKNILKDPQFSPALIHRSNIDLKDKWRNINVSIAIKSSKDKQRLLKDNRVSFAPLSGVQSFSSLQAPNASTGIVTSESLKDHQDHKIGSRFDMMIFEALTSLKDVNGSEFGAIVGYIEQRHNVPLNFRRLLTSKLRRLIAQGRLEKVRNCYKIKEGTLATKMHPRLGAFGQRLEEAILTASYRVAEAEKKSYVMAEAMEEAERVARMAEEADNVLQLAKEIHEQCLRGRVSILV